MPVSGKFPMRCACGAQFLSTEDHRELACRACAKERRAQEKRERKAKQAGDDAPVAQYAQNFRRFRKRRVHNQRYASSAIRKAFGYA